MSPTINNNDWVLFFRYSEPKRFGIFFVEDPKKENHELIKRVVGLPGDKFKHHNIFYVIPQDHYYVLGDNKGTYWGNDLGEPAVSFDSRNFGPVSRTLIHERVVLVYWPFSRVRWVW